jgi:hypothetical protein
MSWEIFSRTMVKTSDPTVTLMRSGRMFLNKSASTRFEEKAVERVLLLWNKESRQVGIKPITKKDTRSYKLSYSGRGNSAGMSAVQFYKYIDYNWETTLNYPVIWNDDEGMYVFTIPSERLTGSPESRRSVLKTKPSLKNTSKQLAAKQKVAAHLTQ